MLSAGRAFMFDKGFRPSSTDGHVAEARGTPEHLTIKVRWRMMPMWNHPRLTALTYIRIGKA